MKITSLIPALEGTKVQIKSGKKRTEFPIIAFALVEHIDEQGVQSTRIIGAYITGKAIHFVDEKDENFVAYFEA